MKIRHVIFSPTSPSDLADLVSHAPKPHVVVDDENPSVFTSTRNVFDASNDFVNECRTKEVQILVFVAQTGIIMRVADTQVEFNVDFLVGSLLQISN